MHLIMLLYFSWVCHVSTFLFIIPCSCQPGDSHFEEPTRSASPRYSSLYIFWGSLVHLQGGVESFTVAGSSGLSCRNVLYQQEDVKSCKYFLYFFVLNRIDLVCLLSFAVSCTDCCLFFLWMFTNILHFSLLSACPLLLLFPHSDSALFAVH